MLKMIGIAIIGTISEVICLLLFSNYTIFNLFILVIEIPLMMLVLVERRKEILIKSIIMGYVFLILINGTLEVLWNIFGEGGHFLTLLILSCFVVITGVSLYLRQKKIQKGIYPVELEHNGAKLRKYAYYDSGNCLKDPYTGKGVHIISETILGKLSVPKAQRVCIPYQSLGNASGLLDVYYIEKLKVFGEKDTLELQKIPLGVTNENLFEGKQYEMILNEEIW